MDFLNSENDAQLWLLLVTKDKSDITFQYVVYACKFLISESANSLFLNLKWFLESTNHTGERAAILQLNFHEFDKKELLRA